MSPEEKSPEDAKLHRPLPTVDIPLLRDHRKAARTRNIAAAAVGASVLIGGLAFVLLDDSAPVEEPNEQRPQAEAPMDAPVGADAGADANVEIAEGAEAPPAETGDQADDASPLSQSPLSRNAVSRISKPFGEAKSFRQALQNAGLQSEDYLALETGLKGVLDFRRCRPDHRLVFERTDDATLIRFEYHAARTEYVLATRSPSSPFTAKLVQRPVKRVRLARKGTVTNSLGAALMRAGLGRSLVGVFVEAFSNQVDFQKVTRTGDSFRIVLEEEYLDGEFLQYGTIHAVEYVGEKTGTLRAFHFEPPGSEGELYDEKGRAINGRWLKPPVRYARVSSPFDPRRMHPILRRIMPHTGVDYAAGTGTPVLAAAAGTVTFAGNKGANGNLVSIRHRGGYETFYAHLHRIASGIKPGTAVRQRQGIGQVGTTGRSTGPHLHFALKRGGRFIDPLTEINGPGKPLPPALLAPYRRLVRRLLDEMDHAKAHIVEIDPANDQPEEVLLD